MSTVYNPANIISNLSAGADLSAESNRYKAVKQVNKTIVVAAAGERIKGFLQNLPASGDAAEVATLGGGSLAIAGGTITANDLLKVDANGDLILASVAGDEVVAVAEESAVDGDVFAVQVLNRTIHA